MGLSGTKYSLVTSNSSWEGKILGKQRGRALVGLICLFFFLGVMAPPAVAAPPVRLKVDGRPLSPGVAPRLANGRVVVPVRAVAEALGAQVEWESRSRQVTLRREGREVRAWVGATAAWRDGVRYRLDVPPFIQGGRLLVPVRFFAEGLGAAVQWDGATREVHIASGGLVPSAGEVWAYYYGRGAQEDLEAAASHLSHVVIYSYSVDARGNLAETSPYPEARQTAHSQGLPASVLIFQNDPQALAALLGDAEARRTFVRQTVDLLRSEGYHGVNLDLEGVPPAARAGYVALVKDLAAAVRPMGKTLSLSLPAKESEDVAWQKGYDYAALGALADRVVIMAYDQHHPGGAPGPVAALDWVERVTRFAASQIPPEKLLLGLGSYGYDWPPWGRAKALTPEAALALAQSLGLTPAWHETAAVPHFRYWDAAGGAHEVWYENLDSLGRKAAVARKYGLRGVAVWRLGFPPEGFWRQIAQAFGVRGAA